MENNCDTTTAKQLMEYSKEELVEMVKDLKSCKKFGLVWEEKPEDVVEQCKVELPVVEEVTKRAVIKDMEKETNLLIEGDNYHALSILNYTHAKKIDIIYIDPPYNTGAKDWKYNNDYVDELDGYRHSKWLSMMNHRLKLAKNLLSESGVLICTIDKYEQERLGQLLEEVYKGYNRVCVTIVHNPAGTQGNNFSYTHEYAYFVFPNEGKYIANTEREQVLVSAFRDWGTISHRNQAKTCFYPIIVKNNKIVGFGDVCADDYHPGSSNIKKKDGSIYVYPVDQKGIERKWVFSRNSVESIKDELFCKVEKNTVTIKREKKETSYKTVWDDSKYYANIHGSKLLNQIIDEKFPFPKSLYAVVDCLKAVIHDKQDATILDFFAGSGTTGHATLLLNKVDGGNRKFILVTNNENKIAEKVTYERIKGVINGYQKNKGIPSNLRYFRTGFVSKSESTDDTRRALVGRCTEMICIRENTFTKKYDNKKYKIYLHGNKATGILFDLDAINEFKQKINELNYGTNIYVFSLSTDTYDEDFEDLAVKHTLCPIPESILEVYRKIFA